MKFLLFMLSWISLAAYGQFKLPALRITEKISVDGVKNEASWGLSNPSQEHFTTLRPSPGNKASFSTTISVLYDDNALYFFIECLDFPDSVSRVLSVRDDNNPNIDFVAIFLDTYNDRQNGFYFGITSMGVQMDGKILSNELNSQLNLVWVSAVKLGPKGWCAELKIPYSAVRFAEKEVQDWNINFTRQIARKREQSCWFPVRPDFENYLVNSGKLVGVAHIKPPLRLSLLPYISSYLNQQSSTKYARSLFGGMDVKFGINEAFTLDLTLVPDFGQVIFDNQVLNTSPFEIEFNENRQFFTEGMELFNKSGIFYSRRIGVQAPMAVLKTNLLENEVIYGVQDKPQLYNATKLSGRTRKGLGVGVFNAVSAPTVGVAYNTVTNEKREFLAAPLTNYNTVVLDQNLRQNSSITLTNTNVTRAGNFYDANVTALNTNLNFYDNLYFLNAKATCSQKFLSTADQLGYNWGIGAGKKRGNLIYSMNYFEEDNHYDNNDLGINPINNRRIVSSNIGYRHYKPLGKFVRLTTNLSISYNRLFTPNVYTESYFDWTATALTKTFDAFGINAYAAFTEKYDYFEPRTWGSYFIVPRWHGAGAWISTNYQKAFAVDANFYYEGFGTNQPWKHFTYTFSPRIRLSKKMLVVMEWFLEQQRSDRGFAVQFSTPVDTVQGILFGERNRNILTQLLELNYTLTNRMNLSLRTRHYWSVLDYHRFFTLNQDGTLLPASTLGLDAEGHSAYNLNYNALTVDCAFKWVVKQGSELSVVWKSSVFRSVQNITPNYFQNMNDLFNAGLFNSFSIKFLYWLDVAELKSTIRSKNKH